MSTQNAPTISNKKRAEIEREARKRVALEKQAFEYVKHLSLTDSVSDEELINIGPHITKGDYADITEERSIEKLCGYPLCSNILKDVLKQKYKISRKNSTVYDITERKKFCSNQCYEASKHFHQQISEIPVYLRDPESQVQFTVLRREESQNVFPRGRNGESVLDCPWYKVKEELKVLDEEDKIEPQAVGVSCKQNSLPIEQSSATEDTDPPGSKSGKTVPSPGDQPPGNKSGETLPSVEDQPLTAAPHTATKRIARPISAQLLLPFSEKVNFIREWKTPRTVEFLHSDPSRVSDYKEKVLQFYGGKSKEETDETKIRLAPVDHVSQHTQRKRIVLQNLSHSWEQLETSLNLDLKEYLEDMKSLIYTFEFSNKNILFKPVEWLAVGYILLRILDGKKKFLNNVRLNLRQQLITEEEVSAIVEYMTSVSNEMDEVD